MLFGSQRDFNLINKLNRELLTDIVEQEVLYYKPDLDSTTFNLYGESTDKTFKSPLKLNCLITRGDQVVEVNELGPDQMREVSFAFLRVDLEDANNVVEVGDIVLWNEFYFEVDVVRENQLVVGRDNSYNLTEYGNQFGSSLSIIADTHLTRAEKVGISKVV